MIFSNNKSQRYGKSSDIFRKTLFEFQMGETISDFKIVEGNDNKSKLNCSNLGIKYLEFSTNLGRNFKAG